MEQAARFCSQCGAANRSTQDLPGSSSMPEDSAHTTPPRRLTRSTRDKKLAGVCGGMANFFGVDSTLVRLIWLGLFLAYGAGAVLYLAAWAIVPRDTDVVTV